MIANDERRAIEAAQREAGRLLSSRGAHDPFEAIDEDRVSERPMPRTVRAAKAELHQLRKEISSLNLQLTTSREEHERRGEVVGPDAPLTDYERWRRRALGNKIYRENRASVLKDYIRDREGLGDMRPSFALHQAGNLMEAYEGFINAFRNWQEAEPIEGANEQGDVEWAEVQEAYDHVMKVVAEVYGPSEPEADDGSD